MTDREENYFENKLSSNWNHREEDEFKFFLESKVQSLCSDIWTNVKNQKDLQNEDIYSGNLGIAYMFLLLSKQPFIKDKMLESDEYLDRARTIVVGVMEGLKKSRVDRGHSFLFGNCGIILMAGLVFNATQEDKYRDHYFGLLVKFSGYYLNFNWDDNRINTLYQGIPGFLCCAQWANYSTKTHIIPVETMQNIVISVMKCGKYDKLNNESDLPIVFENKKGIEFNLSEGMSGALLAMLCTPNLFRLRPEFEPHIRTLVDHIVSKQSPDGSYITDYFDRNRDPVNWSEGSAGVCFLIAKAYMIWNDDNYKKSLLNCGEYLWKRGISKNGIGIANGMAGIGYAFLIIYRAIGEQKYLSRAKRFAQHMFDEEYQNLCNKSTHPYSLFEGWAGVVCYLVALMDPLNTVLPLFFNIFYREEPEMTEDIEEYLSDDQQK